MNIPKGYFQHKGKLFKHSFKGHKGRPGQVGGSRARSGDTDYPTSSTKTTDEDRQARVIYSGLKFMLPKMSREQHEALFEAVYSPGEDPDVTLKHIESYYKANSRVAISGDTPTKLFERMIKDMKG